MRAPALMPWAGQESRSQPYALSTMRMACRNGTWEKEARLQHKQRAHPRAAERPLDDYAVRTQVRPRWWGSRAAAAAGAPVRCWPFSTGRFTVSGCGRARFVSRARSAPGPRTTCVGTQLAVHPTSLPSALYLRLAQLTCRTCIGQPAVYARASTRLVMEWRGCLSDPVQARACTSIRACACSGCVIGGLMPRSTFCHRRQTCFNLSLCASHLFEQRSPCQM